MIKYIRASIGFLVSGILVLALGVLGSLSVKADILRNTSEILYQSAQIAVIVGTALIVLSGLLFILAIIKSR